MADAISIAKASMLYDMHRMQTVSSNLANVATPGYKREITTGIDFAQVLNKYSQVGVTATSVNQSSLSQQLSNIRDNSAGMLKQTNDQYDIALSSDAYIELSSSDGVVYSRGGHFSKDENGRLVNTRGHSLLSSNGDIRVTSDKLSIDVSGRIFDGGKEIGRLNVVSFSNQNDLEYMGNGIYKTTTNTNAENARSAKVLQGYLEMSNVNQADEMVKMIELTRHFETSQKVIKAYDGILDSAINTLGDL